MMVHAPWVCSPPVFILFTNSASPDGAALLPAWRLRARRAQPGDGAAERRLGRDDRLRLGHAPEPSRRRADVLRGPRRPPRGHDAGAAVARPAGEQPADAPLLRGS